MQLMAIKLKRQEDVLCYIENSDDYGITISNPVLVHLDPNKGFYARDWLYLSDTKTVKINKADIYFIHEASERSIEIYDEYMDSIERHNIETNNDESELEEMFTSLLESRKSIKH